MSLFNSFVEVLKAGAPWQQVEANLGLSSLFRTEIARARSQATTSGHPHDWVACFYYCLCSRQDGAHPDTLANGVTNPAISPDGTKIAIVSRPSLDFEIFVMDAYGSNFTRLTTSTGLDLYPGGHRTGARQRSPAIATGISRCGR